MVPFFLVGVARAHLARGDSERARAAAEEAVPLTRDRGSYGADAHIALARVLLGSEGVKGRSEVDSALATAQRFVDSSGAKSRAPYIHEARAELAGLLGDRAERERELSTAHRLFSEMRATGHAERLAKELGL